MNVKARVARLEKEFGAPLEGTLTAIRTWPREKVEEALRVRLAKMSRVEVQCFLDALSRQQHMPAAVQATVDHVWELWAQTHPR